MDAAVELFATGRDVSMTELAVAAGVGRVTLYSHFPTREAVLDAAIQRALDQTVTALEAADLDAGPADEALGRLVRTGWPILDRHRGLLDAEHMRAAQLRGHHAAVLERFERLIRRGQDSGAFRSDLDAGWLVAACYSLIHAAAESVTDGRLALAAAADVLEATLLGMLRPDRWRGGPPPGG